ncbi:MAG TPA: isoprenylcysteine carboxylmethyltransferase family protein [Candidatus Omnitrophota bacterium]|nr:isoprenylcysteine carboxylmethyltransferase family protein [Candidatus Omnitrophota bacterium]
MPTLDPQKIRPPHYLLACLIMATLLQLYFKPARIIGPFWLGVILFAAGIVIVRSALNLFGKHQTPVRHSEQPAALVTGGLYRFTRNPMYVGMELLMLGLGFMAGTWAYLAIPVVMFLILQIIFIPWEEKRMEELFKEEYIKYRQKVRRWL